MLQSFVPHWELLYRYRGRPLSLRFSSKESLHQYLQAFVSDPEVTVLAAYEVKNEGPTIWERLLKVE